MDWERLQAEADRYVRRAWRPRVEPGEGEPHASRFGGRPWVGAGESPPCCGSCGKAMAHAVQLRAGDLPAVPPRDPGGLTRWPLPGDGLLQLFLCRDARCAAADASALARIVTLGAVAGAAGEARVEPAFPARRIAGWTPLDDPPGQEEPIEGWAPADRAAYFAALGDHGIEEEARDPAPGDKLLGWPLWIQGAEHPRCRRCGRAMSYLVQLDSRDHLPVMLGDAGTGWLYACPEHPEAAFVWQCS